jgi:hypothetical protein
LKFGNFERERGKGTDRKTGVDELFKVYFSKHTLFSQFWNTPIGWNFSFLEKLLSLHPFVPFGKIWELTEIFLSNPFSFTKDYRMGSKKLSNFKFSPFQLSIGRCQFFTLSFHNYP